ncbi:MAG: DUF1501 domain-containing protein, partial [Planctomycetota bacterium]|nr:DUF1501 domain-containing protein [Planctomycetota bacterium]
MGFAMMGLGGVLADHGLLGALPSANTGPSGPSGPGPSAASPLAPRAPHFAPRAKRVIHIFLNGGPSHVDTFDPKPLLTKYHGKALPTRNLLTERETGSAFGSPFEFRRYGESGIEISELFSHVGEHADDLCVIRSMQADVPNHEPSLMLMNCGDNTLVRPSMGAWLTYGLGTENRDLPGFIAMCPGGHPVKGPDNWRSAFLPGIYEGTYLNTEHTRLDRLIENIRNPHLGLADQRRQVDLLQALNRRHLDLRGHAPQLEARIQSYEQGYRMQMAASDAFDVDSEPERIREMYGKTVQARQMIIARRLVERGVRFVQLWHGKWQPWDSHDEIEKNHRKLAGECSQAIGALLTDLKQRGLFDETLVMWGGEFGRTPTVEVRNGKDSKLGRDHNHYGFSMWLAGGGVKGGAVYGATDEF